MNPDYLLNLVPKKDPIRFIKPGKCNGFWLNQTSKGCGQIVRLNYMHAPHKSRRGRKIGPDSACCPICGQHYFFAFYKLKGDDDYQPSTEEEQDIRLLYADLKSMAKGNEPSYDLPLEERIRIHALEARGK